MYTLPATLSEDIKYYGTLINDFLAKQIEPVKFKAVRVPMGIYEQRKDGTFMVRIRCAAGYISPSQLKAVAQIAMKYNSYELHITTRQEIQIQGLTLQDTVLVLHQLKEIGLSSRGGGGNTVRNIMVSINSGIATDEVFDVTPYAVNLTSRLIAEPDSFTLPRKFKISFSNTDQDTGYAVFNDLGFIAKIQDGKKGFSVFMGGSLGANPLTGYELFDFAPEEDLFYITDATKKLFSRYGNRRNKHKARLRYVFNKLGKDEVFRLFFEIHNESKQHSDLRYTHSPKTFPAQGITLQPLFVDTDAFASWKQECVSKQQQAGLFSIIIPFEHGNVKPETAEKLASFLESFGDDVIRFSMRQNIHLRNIPENYLGNVFLFLQSIGIKTDESLLLNTLVACTGADTCRLGICLAKGASHALRNALTKRNLDLNELNDFRINISGCPNSCGQQYSADLGFYGKVERNSRMYPAYHIVAGAVIGKNAKLAEHVGIINARDLPSFTADLLQLYLAKQNKYGSFNNYVQAEGKADIERLTDLYNNAIPNFADDKNYYFDWGSEQIFSLASKGIGECSAGLFDMIDVDNNALKDYFAQLDKETDNAVINDLLYKILFSSSRMLLITRGSEPRNEWEVFNEFTNLFINTTLISTVYADIVQIAKTNHNYNFSTKKDTILELANSVIALYENMDDSLQFKIGEAGKTDDATVVKQQSMVRKKDFRGVACPMNFVKTKLELSQIASGELLEILLDDGEPIENVPGSIKGEGHTIVEQTQIDSYWKVIIKKA